MTRYEGFVDHYSPERVAGWAYSTKHPDDPLDIEIWLDGEVVAHTVADGFREDLLSAGKGNGRHAFEFVFSPERQLMENSRPSIRVRGYDRPLVGSPCSPTSRRFMNLPSFKDGKMPTFADLSEPLDDGDLPPADRASLPNAELTERQQIWRRQGYLWLEDLMPHDLLDRYAEARWRLRPSLRPWSCPVSYLYVPEMRDVCLHPPLCAVLDELIGTRMALNLTLTGWHSTERAWHQDDYLNPPIINGWYLAVWIALDDIAEDCGPFEFVPGSHRWPLLRRDKVRSYLPDDLLPDKYWTKASEFYVEPACATEIERRGGEIKQFIARKGDVLVWHARLMHRGGLPTNPDAVRKTLIGHYTAFDRQPEWPAPVQHGDAGWYFPIPGHPLDNLSPEEWTDSPMP